MHSTPVDHTADIVPVSISGVSSKSLQELLAGDSLDFCTASLSVTETLLEVEVAYIVQSSEARSANPRLGRLGQCEFAGLWVALTALRRRCSGPRICSAIIKDEDRVLTGQMRTTA